MARQRRISTASSVAGAASDLGLGSDPDSGGSSAAASEVATVQNGLLDAVISSLTMLRHLSPDLAALIAGDVHDHGQYEQLLAIAFASPSLEQDDGLTYGTLISVANVATRALTRGSLDRDRSPSPAAAAAARASASSPAAGTSAASASFSYNSASAMDRRRLALVLEQSLTVLLSQALLCLSDPRLE